VFTLGIEENPCLPSTHSTGPTGEWTWDHWIHPSMMLTLDLL
jgi:hypothetical protein